MPFPRRGGGGGKDMVTQKEYLCNTKCFSLVYEEGGEKAEG